MKDGTLLLCRSCELVFLRELLVLRHDDVPDLLLDSLVVVLHHLLDMLLDLPFGYLPQNLFLLVMGHRTECPFDLRSYLLD